MRSFLVMLLHLLPFLDANVICLTNSTDVLACKRCYPKFEWVPNCVTYGKFI